MRWSKEAFYLWIDKYETPTDLSLYDIFKAGFDAASRTIVGELNDEYDNADYGSPIEYAPLSNAIRLAQKVQEDKED